MKSQIFILLFLVSSINSHAPHIMRCKKIDSSEINFKMELSYDDVLLIPKKFSSDFAKRISRDVKIPTNLLSSSKTSRLVILLFAIKFLASEIDLFKSTVIGFSIRALLLLN